jgi:hypothetical protein
MGTHGLLFGREIGVLGDPEKEMIIRIEPNWGSVQPDELGMIDNSDCAGFEKLGSTKPLPARIPPGRLKGSNRVAIRKRPPRYGGLTH